ncbi:phosphoenolpyruvate--protein phosphotransferase [Demequina activiva]|uniref:Phosphoenolpyruvate-protein phosphotransferase n=1 Tax=Demequina activiva TaxID=1582364 RepID=A0A919Q1G6_9MICO|nr:phosphoenolpyruvate--protein phosphotransferase [Demequina activiva]GIG53522.1 phosphoenolpyruvate-protein phosphotransferase [Demequina activiva]
MTVVQGIGVSAGIAFGAVVRVGRAVRPPDNEPAADDAEPRIREAFESVASDLEARVALVEDTAASILTATAMLARDPSLIDGAIARAASGAGPATAIDGATREFMDQFAALGGYFAERATDLRDVGDRAIAAVMGAPAPGVPALEEPCILVAHDLAPAETATLDRTKVLGIITEAGGRTSHTAILAAQMAIPAVVKLPEASELADGRIVMIDGDAGAVHLDPSPATVTEHRERGARRARALEHATGPGSTLDGKQVKLLANIGGVDDAVAAGAADVEGVGLFRTEFVFLSSPTAPTVDDQAEIYRQVFEPFEGRRVVVRTLDAGADKPLAFADLGAEENPALGRRGLRLSAERPDLLDAQLEALSVAAGQTGADVWVMAPMVADAQEAAWFARRVRENGLPTVGVMIEIPAAALRAGHVMAEVDFGSLGTNDLAQYTMAADRMQGELAELLDPWQPAVLDVVASAAEGAGRNGKPMGVCGESAGDPLMALVLAGLGCSSLSMAPSRVAMVRFALSRHTFAQCVRLAHLARSARTPADARAAVLAECAPDLAAIL